MSPDTPLSDERRRRIDAICDTFEAAWRAGQTPRIEDQLEKIEAAARPALFKELLLAEWELAEERGTAIKEEDYVARFAEFKDVIRELLGQRKPAARMPEAIAHYRILKPLGAGGMGEVFLAEDTKLDRQVALKLLPRELASDPRRRQRFMTEAKPFPRSIIRTYALFMRSARPPSIGRTSRWSLWKATPSRRT